ncbi:MAG: SpoIIIAH-like family protein [Clostridia bacterium]|nr:SpoIIIAH-like family protein [Clostridia bacterium]
MNIKNVLKKNQLAILVIALMLVTAGYLNYTSKEEALQTISNTTENGEQYAAIRRCYISK